MRQKVFHSLKKQGKGYHMHMQPAGTWVNALEENLCYTYIANQKATTKFFPVF